MVLLLSLRLVSALLSGGGGGNSSSPVQDDDIYIMVKCMSVCHVFAYFIFSHFWALLSLEIREKVSRNRRNDKKCLEMGENENPFSPISRHFWV